MKRSIAALVLAAGRSTRFGSDKLVAEFRGRPMVEHVLGAALAAGLSPVVVVVGPDREIRWPAARVVVNPDPSRGLSSSLKVGLNAVAGDEPVGGVVVLLGDQPMVSPAVIAMLLGAARDRPIVVPRYADGEPGNPVILERSAWPLAAQLRGDRGMVQLFATHPDLVRYVDVPGANPDVDTAAQLVALEHKQIVAAGYDAFGPGYLAWSKRVVDPARARMLAELIGRLPAGASVLDVGCGPGVPSTKQLSEKFVVTGVDISAAQLDLARRNVPGATFVHADIVTVGFAPASFDIVTALYSLTHLPRDEHASLLGKVARWLRPGGLLLATFSAEDSPDWVGEWLGQQMYFSGFAPDVTRRLLADAGFEILLEEEVEIEEPDGPARFLWVLASHYGSGASRA
jgi:CTP:molybdopterin cytidylyltransferase MocA/SAM-dependent methyltransferase